MSEENVEMPPPKRSTTALMVLLAVLLGGVILVARVAVLGDPNEQNEPADWNEARSSFLEECNQEAQDRGFCSCSYDWFEANVPYERFKEINDSVEADPKAPLPPEFRGAADACD
jgi:hypothetical protein